MPEPDVILLQQFVQGSDAAFRQLVVLRIDFVYGAALRQVWGDTHLAEEVAQLVFIDLARKARVLTARPNLSGWLYTTTRFAAMKALRSRRRQLRHETKAQAMHEVLSAGRTPDPDWNELRPVLDAAMHELSDADREAILLRYFAGRTLAQVGSAIGLAENSARMRVDRALDKLRIRLSARGITSTTAALSAALLGQPTITAPVGLASSAAAGALAASASAAGAAVHVLSFMSITKIMGGLAAMGFAFLAGTYWGGTRPLAARLGAASAETPIPSRAHAAPQSDTTSLPEVVARLEAERATWSREAADARSRTAQIEAELRAIKVEREAELRQKKQMGMLNNLRQIAAARDRYRLEKAQRPPTTAALVGSSGYIRAINSADGEDYGPLDLSNKGALSVTSPSGITAVYYESPPAEIREHWNKALSAYRAAHNGEGPAAQNLRSLLPYFQGTKEAADYAEWLEAEPTVNR